MMKTRVKKRLFLTVEVIVNVRRAYNLSHYIRLDPVCQLNAPCTSIGLNCMLLIVFPLSDEASLHNHIIIMQCLEPQNLC
jgi:hypothetical protein